MHFRLPLVVFMLVLAGSGTAFAQPRTPVECPRIEIDAPKHKLAPDEEARFTVRITPKKPEWRFRYNWTLSEGEPSTGQDSHTITVRRATASFIDATVSIAGGPDDSICPVVSTDRAAWATEKEQSQQSTDCPTITVSGPVGIVDPDPFKFSAKVEGKLPHKVKYEWTVSTGQIIDGQGTSAITVVHPDPNQTLTATVEISPLPKGCIGHASESTAPIDRPTPFLIDEVEQPITKLSEQVLRTAAQEQKNNPNSNLYIIAYANSDVSQFDVRQAVKKVSDFLIKEMKLTASEFEIVTVRSETNAVKIYRIPPGAEKPSH